METLHHPDWKMTARALVSHLLEGLVFNGESRSAPFSEHFVFCTYNPENERKKNQIIIFASSVGTLSEFWWLMID